MKEIFLLPMIIFIFSCSSKNDPLPQKDNPNISLDTKLAREANVDSLMGTWINFLNKDPYRKIIISKNISDFQFEHYIKVSGSYALDQEELYTQVFTNSAFTPWDKSSSFLPYLTLNVKTYSSGKTDKAVYKVIDGVHFLEIGLYKYQKTY